jgi:hypothetical protein
MEQLQILRLTPVERKRCHQWMGRKVIANSRARIRKQQDLEGAPFKAREYRSRKKLLKRLLKGSAIKAYVGPSKATVTWPNSRTGAIARGQQQGFKEGFTKNSVQRGQPDYNGPATERQIKSLLKASFKRYVGKYKGGQKKGQAKKRRVSKAWIQENMTQGQAGLVLRLIRANTNNAKALQPGKNAWVVEVPERAFFGLSHTEIESMKQDFFDERLGKIKNANT